MLFILFSDSIHNTLIASIIVIWVNLNLSTIKLNNLVAHFQSETSRFKTFSNYSSMYLLASLKKKLISNWKFKIKNMLCWKYNHRYSNFFTYFKVISWIKKLLFLHSNLMFNFGNNSLNVIYLMSFIFASFLSLVFLYYNITF